MRSGKFGRSNYCRMCAKAKLDQWRLKNPEKIAAAHARRRESGRSAMQRAAYRLRHPEKIAEEVRKRQEKRRRPRRIRMSVEDRRDSKRKWKRENPESVKVSRHRNRSKRANAKGRHTKMELADLYVLQKGSCAICGCCLSSGYEVDHINPIALGGSNDIKNIQLLCRACNRAKSAKHPIQFMQQRGFLL